nr:unnamed protein product [Spirometra erinaceieuropaei]
MRIHNNEINRNVFATDPPPTPGNSPTTTTTTSSPYLKHLRRHKEAFYKLAQRDKVKDINVLIKNEIARLNGLFRFVDRVLHGLSFVYAHINDLRKANSAAENTQDALQRCLTILSFALLLTHPSAPSTFCLGHLVDSNNIHHPPSKVVAIHESPPPTSKRQLQCLSGMVNFYRRSPPNCTDIILRLTNLLETVKSSFDLSVDALSSFGNVMAALVEATLLNHSAPDAPISLMVDVLSIAVGAVHREHDAGRT